MASSSSDAGWHPGAYVRIFGLAKAPQHNGKTGKISAKPPKEEGRIGVDLGGGKTLAVRRENLELVADVVRANNNAGAAELAESDAMRVVVQSERIVITRCADPDDSVYMQVMPQPGINDWLEANQVECWCQSVGTFGPPETVFVVAAFSKAQAKALPQPRDEIELSDHTLERAVLESEPFNAFGVRFRVTAAPAIDQVSFGLREERHEPAPALDAVKGTAILASCFVLRAGGGEAAATVERLALPPPMSNGVFKGVQRENATMKVWCGIGESDTSISCSELDALPTVPRAALSTPPFEPLQRAASTAAASADADGQDVVAIGMLLERCGATSNKEEFEVFSINAFLHGPHVRQQPEMAVPDFCKRCADDPKALATVRARTSETGVRVSWMEKGRGM